MTDREGRLFELEHARYLCAAYGPLCIAAGYDVAQLTGGECYMLASAIRSALKSRARVITKGSFCKTDYVGALREMSPSELAEMRARIK